MYGPDQSSGKRCELGTFSQRPVGCSEWLLEKCALPMKAVR
jgi:hypothetical protein